MVSPKPLLVLARTVEVASVRRLTSGWITSKPMPTFGSESTVKKCTHFDRPVIAREPGSSLKRSPEPSKALSLSCTVTYCTNTFHGS